MFNVGSTFVGKLQLHPNQKKKKKRNLLSVSILDSSSGTELNIDVLCLIYPNLRSTQLLLKSITGERSLS